MYNFITILIGKAIAKLGNLLGRGSVAPGEICFKFNKKLFYNFKLPANIICVTGSSGKGSTCNTIVDGLRNEGHIVGFNDKGSNITSAVYSTLLELSDFRGNVNVDFLVFELDERYCKEVFKAIKPSHVVINNITRDQPPRQAHTDFIYEEIIRELSTDSHLILNGDDPILTRINLKNNYEVTYFGVDKNKFSYTSNKFKNLNMKYCPKCNLKLLYNYYNFEVNGDFYCTCGFKRNKIDYLVTKINYKNKEIMINSKLKFKLIDNTLYYIYNSLGAIATLSLFDINYSNIKLAIENRKGNDDHHVIYKHGSRIVDVLNTKAENSSTYNGALLYIDRYKDKKVIVIGWKEISRRYEFDDLSWLFDIDFELFKEHDIDSFICMGINRYDIALRLKYAGFNEDIIKSFYEVKDAVNYIKESTKGDIYGVLNFDHVAPFNNFMRSDNNEN